MLAVIRAHECVRDGYHMHMWRDSRKFPPVITLFSAPNYCGSYHNKGAVLVSEAGSLDVRTFHAKAAKHP